jgi:hypothetical protein
LLVFLNMGFHGEVLLAPRPTPKLEDHPSLAVRDCLFNLFAATLHIRGGSSIHNLRTCHAVVCTGFWLGNLRERGHWGDPDVDGRIILRWIFGRWERVVGARCRWLRIGTSGGRLWVR